MTRKPPPPPSRVIHEAGLFQKQRPLVPPPNIEKLPRWDVEKFKLNAEEYVELEKYMSKWNI